MSATGGNDPAAPTAMSIFQLDQVLQALDLELAAGESAPEGGMSGASLARARTRAGEPVVVKFSVLDSDLSRDQAARELTVFTELAAEHGIPTPRLLASHRTASWQAIALAAHDPAPPAPQWIARDWEELGQLLGKLHSGVHPVPQQLRHRRSGNPVLRRDLPAFARQLWNGPGDDGRVQAVLADLDQLTEAAGSGPTSFVHGDCHLGNLLRDGSGRLLLVDWQSSGVGPSAGDLAFALTRAVPTGATIPRDQAIAAYCERAGVEVGPTDRRITAQQLLTLVTQYPAFAGFLGEAEVTHLRSALDMLLARWSAGR
jgi:aminoglycoside phosphotransferase (APT) family kinase protein